MNKTILVTGGAGFIGFHVCDYLLKHNYKVISIDNLNNYYSKDLKKQRIKYLKKKYKNLKFIEIDIANYKKVFHNLKKFKIYKINNNGMTVLERMN